MNKARCYLIHGSDYYRSYRALKTIENHFLAKDHSMSDLIRYDMEETSPETLKQTILTVPFFVSHRLFILKNVFSAQKSAQEGIAKLITQVSSSTVVVFYESRSCDKRLELYKWLKQAGTVQEYVPLTGIKLSHYVTTLANECNVTIGDHANSLLTKSFGFNTGQMAYEVKKCACYVLSQGRHRIDPIDVDTLCVQGNEASLFELANTLREGKRETAITLYRHFIMQTDPMLLAATLASQIRTLVKLYLCIKQGESSESVIARITKLNPYVVKLNLPMAKKMTNTLLKQAYTNLIWFDASVKDGRVAPDLGILLLIVRLHGTLRREER